METNTTAPIETVKWNSNIPFEKKSDYIVRFTDLSFAPSSKDNLMITLKSEVAAPDSVETMVKPGEYKNVVVAGVRLKDQYYTITVYDNGVVNTEKTEKSRARWNDFRAKLELAPEENWDNPALEDVKKVLAYCLIENEESIQTASPTREELAKGIKVGKALLHPKTKEPLVKNFPYIREVYCKAELPGQGGL